MLEKWLEDIKGKINEMQIERNRKLGEQMEKSIEDEIQLKKKIAGKYKDVIPKAGKLPQSVLQSFLKKLKANTDAELDKSLTTLKEKQSIERNELRQSYTKKVSDFTKEQEISVVTSKIKKLLRNCHQSSLKSVKSDEDFTANISVREFNIHNRGVPCDIPKIDNSENILKSLNLHIYNEQFLSKLKKTSNA